MKTALFLLAAALTMYGFMSPCSTFDIEDLSSPDLGNVTISGVAAASTVAVPSPNTYSTSICYTAISVTINGQTAVYPNSATIQTADGSYVKVVWISSNGIEVFDSEVVNSPAQ